MYLKFKISPTAWGSLCLNDDSELWIKLENEKVIKFKNIDGIECENSSYLYSRFKFLDKDDIVNLKSSPMTLIRLYQSGGYIDIKVKERCLKSSFLII